MNSPESENTWKVELSGQNLEYLAKKHDFFTNPDGRISEWTRENCPKQNCRQRYWQLFLLKDFISDRKPVKPQNSNLFYN